MGYKSTLLSTLVTIRYTKPIDKLEDLASSGLPLLMAQGGACISAIKNSPRSIVRQIYDNGIIFNFTQENEEKYSKLYYKYMFYYSEKVFYAMFFQGDE